MSLHEIRAQLRIDVDQLMAEAELAERDGEAMRAAILDALEIHTEARGRIEASKAGGAAVGEIMAEAAERMAERLQRLSRVHVSTEEIELPTDLGLEL